MAYAAPMQLRSIVIWSALALVAASCSSKKKDGSERKPAATGGEGATSGGKPAHDRPAGVELATSAELPGIEWKATELPFDATLDLPIGRDWALNDNQLEGKDGTVVMLQVQDGVSADQLDEYLASYEQVQQRDAPNYVGKPSTKGVVNGLRAVRVEGAFDNGTKFVTRDYLLFTGDRVLALSARAPADSATNLPGLIDHIARSARSK